MRAPLRQRFGLADRAAETRTDRGVMARTLAYPFALGGTVALVCAAVAPSEAVPRLAASAAVCWAAAALALVAYDAMPRWSFPPLNAIGAALLLWSAHASPGSAHASAPMLALPAAYAAFFLRKHELVATVA